MDDLISRQAAIDVLKVFTQKDTLGFTPKQIVEALPSARPERKTGKWVPHKERNREYIGTVLINVEYDYWLCDTCGYRVKNGQPMYNFCPNCGADMRGEQDE